MWGRFGRAWRRLLAGMALLAAFLVLSWSSGAEALPFDPDLHGPVATTLILGLTAVITALIIVAPPLFILTTIAPGLLAIIETLMIALIVSIPFLMARRDLGLPAWIDCVVLGAWAYSISKVLSGLWLPRLARRDTAAATTRFLVGEPHQDLWARLVPLPENRATYYWPRAQFMAAPDGSDADFVLEQPVRRNLVKPLDAIWVEALQPGRSITFRSEPVSDPHGMKERQTITLEPMGDRTMVTVTATFLDVPLGARFRLWMNNEPKDYFASLKYHAKAVKDRSIHGLQALPA